MPYVLIVAGVALLITAWISGRTSIDVDEPTRPIARLTLPGPTAALTQSVTGPASRTPR